MLRGPPQAATDLQLSTAEENLIRVSPRKYTCTKRNSTLSLVILKRPLNFIWECYVFELTFAVMLYLRCALAWVQINKGNAVVGAVFKTTSDGFVHAGLVEAKSGCWSMLKGGLTVKTAGPAELYFEVSNL